MITQFLKAFLVHICKIVDVPKKIEEEGTISIPPRLEYVPNELIHHIQSLLPAKDAARTCVLSKSWLHAWSTIHTLRFAKCVPHDQVTKEEEVDYIKLIDRTLLRYLNDNMSIECFHLHVDIYNSSLPYPLENWLQTLASGNCLKELSLTMCGMEHIITNEVRWLTLPDAIFSCVNLNTISLRVDSKWLRSGVRVNTHPVIKCSFLRVLELYYVCISEGALHNLFSSCSLLEKIHIDFDFSVCLKKIMVKNLRFLRELKISLVDNDVLEIYDVPSLRLLSYRSIISKYTTMRMDTLRSVRELVLLRATIDDVFSDMIKSKFPFLETLNLSIDNCMLETIDITCVSLERLTLSMCLNKQMNIQVYASKLLYFSYEGDKMPTLLFPSSTPAHIKLTLMFLQNDPIDLSFFLKLRETLDLSSNFHIEAIDDFVPLNIHLEDLRRMVPFPARNVQQLSFGKHWQKKLWKHSPLLDFLFSICYPRYVKAYYRSTNSKNYLYQQIAGMMEKKTCNLKDIEIKNPRDGKWESLTSNRRSYHFLFELPWRSFVLNDKGDDFNSDEFKLYWLS